MPQIIDVPNIGQVEFPDGMTDAQMAAALQHNFPEIHSQAVAAQQAQDAQTYDPTAGMSIPEKLAAGFDSGLMKAGRGVRQIIGDAVTSPYVPSDIKTVASALDNVLPSVSRANVDEANRLSAPLEKTGAGEVGTFGGIVAPAIPLSMIPGANTALGSTLLGMAQGATQQVGTQDSRAANTAFGGLFGLGGYGSGKLMGKVVGSAQNKMAKIETAVKEKAAAQAAADTASARSAAGNAAQNAYRQLEHLRELGAMRSLTPEEAQLAASLEKELAGKAMEKLVPAAAQKEATAQAYKEAMATEAKRAADLAAQKLSNSEIKSQIMARVKRYGPAALGGAVGNFIFPGLGAIGGAATGLVLRPALRSMINLSKNPAVQHALLSPVANAGLLANPYLPQALGLLGSSIYAAQQ